MSPDASLGTFHERTGRLFEAMMGISTGLELRTTLHRIVVAATETVDASYGALAVLDATGTGMGEFIHVGMSPDIVAGIGHTPRGLGVLGQVIRHPEPLRIGVLRAHPSSAGFPPGHPDMQTFLGVPVVIRDEVFGNLYMTEKRGGGEFTADDERLLIALASAAAAAIDNARLYESAQQRERWQRSLAEVAQAGLEGQSVSQLLAIIAAGSRDLVRADTAFVALADDDGDIVVEHIDGDPHLFTLQPGDTVTDSGTIDPSTTAITVPMLGRDSHPGIVTLAWRGAVPVDQSQTLDMATTFVEQAGLILLLTLARQEHERLAIFEERDRIARDLHDLVVQRIFAAGIQLQGAMRSPDPRERIPSVIDSLDETIHEIRRTIVSLESDAQGYTTRGRILQELEVARGNLGFAPHLVLDGPVDTLVTEDLADHVVAVLREGLTNVARHACASNVVVEVCVDSSRVSVIVRDDGDGIAQGSRRSGLANIEQRATLLGGEATIERVSVEGGTVLSWHVPLS